MHLKLLIYYVETFVPSGLMSHVTNVLKTQCQKVSLLGNTCATCPHFAKIQDTKPTGEVT